VRCRIVHALASLFAIGCITTTYQAGESTMAVPGPVAFDCISDSVCGTHHCNTQLGPDGGPYNKCAFPCQSAADCIAPNACVAGLCVPQPNGN
jgi:hypothetical protein